MSRETTRPSPLTTPGYLSGARPIVGTVGACGLMLFACSWFALGAGDLGRNNDVATPAPVHIGYASGERATAVPQRTARGRHISATRSAVAHTSTARPASQSAAPAAPSPTAQPSAPAVQAAQGAPEPPAVTTPPLPAPLDGLPEVTFPPISVPQVPAVQLPDVSTVTTQLGLP